VLGEISFARNFVGLSMLSPDQKKIAFHGIADEHSILFDLLEFGVAHHRPANPEAHVTLEIILAHSTSEGTALRVDIDGNIGPSISGHDFLGLPRIGCPGLERWTATRSGRCLRNEKRD
jgi:hypothetical protein